MAVSRAAVSLHEHQGHPGRFAASGRPGAPDDVDRAMQIGVVYPQTELALDPVTVRAYVRGVEQLGFRHILVYDHVVGADPAVYTGWNGPYDVDTTFHEPFVMFGFLAAVTQLELVTGIIIAPQRQTALIAKQAAEVDILTEGRFRLGIGVGWNRVEYESLGQDFHTRGRRQEEQIGLLRLLWTERSVEHDGEFDRIKGAGIAPLPVQRPIPIWMGGASEAAYLRIGRLADGWFPMTSPGEPLSQAREHVAAGASLAGRDPGSIGMEGRIEAGEQAARHADKWRAAGASHLTINTMGDGHEGVAAHLKALELTAKAIPL
ncbi:MAG TPA: LLM class F420-dependent oxidoreductase [Acidimicrobiales bacterium]|nr:LLM class F420-dependent oxidoreductase [Acidimicrobiales bacterium]